jgi:hypothetical protein
MIYFPTSPRISRPYTRTILPVTARVDMESGRRIARSVGPDAFPSRWDLTYSNLTNAQLTVLRDFYDARKGSYESFAFLDPNGNLVSQSEDFAHSSWTRTSMSAGLTVADPLSGTSARSITGSNWSLQSTVLPDGDGDGLTLCASIYARGSGVIRIGLWSGGWVGNNEYPLGATWRRVTFSSVLNFNSIIALRIEGSTNCELFGAKVSPLPGPGEYLRSPICFGLHRNCRFDSDFVATRPYYKASNVNLSILSVPQ